MTDKKVTIEMTEKQARIVLEAVEEWFRLRLAQRSDLANGLAFLGYDWNRGHLKDEKEFDSRIERRNALDIIIQAMLDIAFPCIRNGIPYEVTPETHIASDIWSQLRWELSDKEEWRSTPFQLGSEPMVKVIVEDK